MLCSIVLNGEPEPTLSWDPVVPWWSFTKPVLAAAALALVRDGLINLDAPVQEHPFTLRQLLKHQAGLADYGELSEYHAAVADRQVPWPADDMMQRLDGDRLRYVPGAAWRYSNVGYMLVARLIERVTGLSIENALAHLVFQPLGLERVRLAKTPQDLMGVHPETLLAYHPGWVYHGLLLGPLSEATRLLDRLLTGPLLPCTLLHEMQDAIDLGGPLPGRPWANAGYGLGLMIGTATCGLRLTGHTGAGPGGIIAVYQCSLGGHTATGSVFAAGDDQGQVETHLLEQLRTALSAQRTASAQ